MKYVTIILDLTPGSCPRWWGPGSQGLKRKKNLTKNLILVHSWWNFLTSLNFAFGGKDGDL